MKLSEVAIPAILGAASVIVTQWLKQVSEKKLKGIELGTISQAAILDALVTEAAALRQQIAAQEATMRQQDLRCDERIRSLESRCDHLQETLAKTQERLLEVLRERDTLALHPRPPEGKETS